MRKSIMCLSPLALVACDGPAEEVGEELDDAAEAQAEAMDERVEALEEMADNPEAAEALEGAVDGIENTSPKQLEAEAEKLEDAADGI